MNKRLKLYQVTGQGYFTPVNIELVFASNKTEAFSKLKQKYSFTNDNKEYLEFIEIKFDRFGCKEIEQELDYD